jgi:hypothetical protein
MHQQARATEQPLALKMASRSGHRAGVRGNTVSLILIATHLTSPNCYVSRF